MLKYLARRLSATIVVLTLVSMSVFGIFAVLPMDPAALTCGKACYPAVIEANRHRLGLDVPVHVQYGRFVKGLVAGRTYGEGAATIECPAPAFGYSFNRHECVTTVIKEAFPVTLSLALGAFILWISVGVGLGILAARRKNQWPDRAATAFVLIGTSLPSFITGILILLFVGLKFNLIDPLSMGRWIPPLEDPVAWFRTFIFPWIVLALLYSLECHRNFDRRLHSYSPSKGLEREGHSPEAHLASCNRSNRDDGWSRLRRPSGWCDYY